jgi:hypothetical protein
MAPKCKKLPLDSGAGGGIRTLIQVEMSPEDQTFSRFVRFFDIPNELYELSKDKCFREKEIFLSDWISFLFCLR